MAIFSAASKTVQPMGAFIPRAISRQVLSELFSAASKTVQPMGAFILRAISQQVLSELFSAASKTVQPMGAFIPRAISQQVLSELFSAANKTVQPMGAFILRAISQQVLWRWMGLICLCLLLGCQRPPQIADDPAVFKELDALYTAITARNLELLEASSSRLETLHQAGQLSGTGYSRLAAIIKQAARAEWSPAAQALSDLMRTQRPSRNPINESKLPWPGPAQRGS